MESDSEKKEKNILIWRTRKNGEPLKLSMKGILGMSFKKSHWIIIQKHLQLKEERQLELGRLFGRLTTLN